MKNHVFVIVLSHMNGMIRCDLTEYGYPSFFASEAVTTDRSK